MVKLKHVGKCSIQHMAAISKLDGHGKYTNKITSLNKVKFKYVTGATNFQHSSLDIPENGSDQNCQGTIIDPGRVDFGADDEKKPFIILQNQK